MSWWVWLWRLRRACGWPMRSRAYEVPAAKVADILLGRQSR
jgi:hypothetical protein